MMASVCSLNTYNRLHVRKRVNQVNHVRNISPPFKKQQLKYKEETNAQCFFARSRKRPIDTVDTKAVDNIWREAIWYGLCNLQDFALFKGNTKINVNNLCSVVVNENVLSVPISNSQNHADHGISGRRPSISSAAFNKFTTVVAEIFVKKMSVRERNASR